ncbi:MAG: DUF455 family protein [Verrucomicrobiales bacterium]|nr:DUF455 family protein [Verrucomicrobiales bacterium]
MSESISSIAERVLFSESLDDKLILGPSDAEDSGLSGSINLPDLPSREKSIEITTNRNRANFPGIDCIDNEKDRGKLLHFLANHELLAAELMALAILRFPKAPSEYRKGLYEAMREEQIHTRLYLKRMKECGVSLGEFPLNDFFWRITSRVENELDFITRMNLTFEQANLDYSKYYAKQFRLAGDKATAVVLEKIYHDEIGHVGHGLKWLRHWKKPQQTDWQAYNESIHLPLSATRAKGVVEFNEEARLQVGFDADFISRLKIFQRSRGRTPVVHWFNPNAELHSRAHLNGNEIKMNRFETAIEKDLEILMAAFSKRDDIVLFRELPSVSHLEKLQSSGFEIPDAISENEIGSGKLGGFRPWAWSPEASQLFKPFAQQVSKKVKDQWRPPVPGLWLSKEIGYLLEKRIGSLENNRSVCRDADHALSIINSNSVVYKPGYGCAGKGFRIANDKNSELEKWLSAVIKENGFVIAEPWVERVEDFSVHYHIEDGKVDFLGVTKVVNDHRGRFRGIDAAPRWSKLINQELAAFLYKEELFGKWYHEIIPKELGLLLDQYNGPVSIDAMIWRDSYGNLCLRKIVEINVRMTMGRVALDLQKRMAASKSCSLRIEKKNSFKGEEGLVLNDPDKAIEFLAVWKVNDNEVIRNN